MLLEYQGTIDKMASSSSNGAPIRYSLPLGTARIDLNPLINQKITLQFQHSIRCMACGRSTSKSFSQGYCYPCMQRLARCDQCIIKPELCHYHQGTCREPEWGEKHCLQDHIVYLSNTSGIKVGVTRQVQMETRWTDQGAIQAMPILRTSERKIAGIAEHYFKQWLNDKTNWRAMLKGDNPYLDMPQHWQQLQSRADELVSQLHQEYGIQSITKLEQEPVWQGQL